MIWTIVHPRATHDTLGFIPTFLNDDDPRPAREQLDANYRHGGGWRPFQGFTLMDDYLSYAGDPPLPLLAETRLRDETVRVYEYAWVAIVQPDGSYEIARMD